MTIIATPRSRAASAMTQECVSMVPESYHDFFVASVGASAALVGLLFVAISLAPERVFGAKATGDRQAFAVSAFIVLSNILFISFSGLLPFLNIGIMIVVSGSTGLVNLVLLVVAIGQRGTWPTGRGVILLLGSLTVYALELWWGTELLRDRTRTDALENVMVLLLVAYSIALARAWELLGGQDYSLVRSLVGLIRRKPRRESERAPDTRPS